MQFVGTSAFRENFPIVEVGLEGRILDLHNDGELRHLMYDFAGRAFRITWTLKQPAWKTPRTPDTSQRPTEAAATLLLTGVRSVSMQGQLVTSEESEGGGLDFVEYRRLSPGLGELRFVFIDDAEITISASRCELQTTHG